jgi:2-polyprenyl-3-methyl-5-hydroxy-6-metoxy-1,4-benzoquinol methylase
MNISPSHILSETPLSPKMLQALIMTSSGLFNDLLAIDPLQLDISEYNKKYLTDILKDLYGNLYTYACVIGGALSDSQKTLSDIVFIEYGGGTGFMSLIAKRMGVGTVIYNDIYDVSCKDASEIALTLDCQADYYVNGGIEELIEFCYTHNFSCDCMVSYNVLEHIYDITDFCSKLSLLSHKGTSMVHASTANMTCPPKTIPVIIS